MPEPKDPLDSCDAEHGTPGSTPDKPKISPEAEYGTDVNPLRETPEPYKNLQKIGGE